MSRSKNWVYGNRHLGIVAIEDLHVRAAAVIPTTLNEQQRTIDATLITERPVPMYDWRRDLVFDEVLFGPGGSWRAHVVLLDSHRSWDSRSTIGSVSPPRLVDNSRWDGTLSFVRGDPDVDKIWNRVAQGHLRGVSGGYRYERSNVEIIPPGENRMLRGRMFRAGEREKRVVMLWQGHEVSTTPLQADEDSQTRSRDPNSRNWPACYEVENDFVLSRSLRGDLIVGYLAYLRSLGLGEQVTNEQIIAFHESLTGAQRAQADQLYQQEFGQRSTEPAPASVAVVPSAGPVAPRQAVAGATTPADPRPAGHGPVTNPVVGAAEPIRTLAPAPQPIQQTPAPPAPQADPFAQLVQPEPTGRALVAAPVPQATVPPQQATVPPQQATDATAERTRVENIMALSEVGGIPQDTVRRAISGGWDLDQARREFIAIRQAPQTPPAQPQTNIPTAAPAGHVHHGGNSLRTLQMALLMRQNYSPDQDLFQQREITSSFRKSNATWICEWNRAISNAGTCANAEYNRAIDDAYSLREWSLFDFCRELLIMDGVNVSSLGQRELVQRALSAPNAALLFTTSFNTQLLEAYTTVEDTTRGWVRESDMPNWQPAERHQKELVSRLRRQARGAAAEQTTFDTTKELIQVLTYAERFDMTREDVLDDRMGGLDSTPADLGIAAGELRPDLVYATLLTNPNMSDGNPIFGAIPDGIDNDNSGMSFDSPSLDTAKSKMHTQKSGGRLIKERAAYWVVPETQSWQADRVLQSAEDRNPSGLHPTKNVAQGKFQKVAEPRLDAGVVNPETDLEVAGSPTTHFLQSAGGRRGLECAYLRADARAPITDQYMLTEGRLGMGWSVNMVIGVRAIGRSGMSRLRA